MADSPVYGFVPDTRPRITNVELISLLEDRGVSINLSVHPLWIIGIRGYYLNSMGRPGLNDRGIYDDAIFIYSDRCFRAFNANTDPSIYREGSGDGDEKGIATLKPGIWIVYRFAMHDGKYLALCQRGGDVTVLRDGPNGTSYEDTNDNFGINIHKGGYRKVSSIGCQTIYPDQWNEFIQASQDLAEEFFGDNWNKVNIPYALIDQ